MIVELKGLIKILKREFKGMYTEERIKEIIEKDGASYFNTYNLKITYLNFGKWKVER